MQVMSPNYFSSFFSARQTGNSSFFANNDGTKPLFPPVIKVLSVTTLCYSRFFHWRDENSGTLIE